MDMESYGLSHDDAQDRDLWRLRIRRKTDYLQMAVKKCK